MAKPKKTAAPKAGKPKTAKPKAKANSAPKPTAEQLSDQQRQVLLLSYRRKIKPLLVAEKSAKANVTKQYELAKKEGITKKDIETALLLETEEGREKVTNQIQSLLNVDRWVGGEVGTQLDMFTTDNKTKNFEDGRLAALDDQAARPPGHLSQAASQRWMDGHAAGRLQLNESRSIGFKSLGETAAGIVPGALGTEPATHVTQQ